MIAAVLLLSAWLSAVLAAALIALANRTHWHAVTGSSAGVPGRRRNKTLGGVLLLLTVVLAVLRDGWGMGLLLGPLLIATGIATMIAILAVRPRSLRLLASPGRSDRRG